MQNIRFTFNTCQVSNGQSIDVILCSDFMQTASITPSSGLFDLNNMVGIISRELAVYSIGGEHNHNGIETADGCKLYANTCNYDVTTHTPVCIRFFIQKEVCMTC